jgi:uncharacterized protein (TIGR02186 family)
MRRAAALLGAVTAAITAVMIATPAAAEKLVSSLSSHRVLITPSFVGTELVLFGTVEADGATVPRRGHYDIVATVTGPRETLVVRRKDRVIGIWVNVDARTFVQVPSYLAVLATRPVDEIGPVDVLRRLQLGLRRTLLPQQIGPDMADTPRDDPFRTAFLRLKQSHGLYVEATDLTFVTPMLYRGSIPLPASAPVGSYEVEVKLFADGALVTRAVDNFEIAKFGFEQFVAASAVNRSLLYGLATVMMALLTGWAASVIFRRD